MGTLAFIGSTEHDGRRDFCLVSPEIGEILQVKELDKFKTIIAEKLGPDWRNKKAYKILGLEDLLDKHLKTHDFKEWSDCTIEFFEELMDKLFK
jgi:hypothetical protein